MQTILCIYWINPFFWWLKNELYLIHEFIADEKSVENNNAAAFAEMLLTAKYGKFEFLPAQPFFYSSIKRRLIMLTTSKKSNFSYLRRIMILPLLAGVLCLFAFNLKENSAATNRKVITSKTNFKLVVDAGHGGQDYGATGNGIYEKDIALKIAQKIKSLAPQYGIDVILTRDADVYMSPPQKSDFANAQNANAFISIHVNAADKDNMSNSGMDVILSRKNTKILDNSRILGSGIIQSLQTDFNVTPALQQKQVGIWIIDNSNIPSALIECGYITNANDVKMLRQEDKIELIAKNVLHGVALYANNGIDKSRLYNIENKDSDTSLPSKLNSMLKKQQTSLYILEGKVISKTDFDKMSLEPGEIISIDVLKDACATDKYGEKVKNGVIEITSDSDKNSLPVISQTEQTII